MNKRKPFQILTKVFLINVILTSVIAAHAQLVLQTDFENHAPGVPYTSQVWYTDGIKTLYTEGMDSRTAIDTTHSYQGEKSLKVFYPVGNHGPKFSGAQAPLVIPPQIEYYMSYALKFDENFSWGGSDQGGKLPGLAAGQNCSGCVICDGTNGFTARFMWRKGGKAVLYLYSMTKESRCGDDYDLILPNGELAFFKPGEWIHLTERVKINDGDQSNGEVQIWFNGQEVLLIKGLKFVNNGQKIDNFYFSTFHGGSGEQWSPENDSYIWFDDIKVSTKFKDVSYR